MKLPRALLAAGCLAGLLLGAWAVGWLLHPSSELVAVQAQPLGVMGTQVELIAVVPASNRSVGQAALAQAEQALRGVEARMSTYIEASELSTLNAAPAGEAVKLSADTMNVIRLARDMHRLTNGAFDATCLPLFRLWAAAGKRAHLPSEQELAEAKSLCGWDKFIVMPDGVAKTVDGAALGLDGVAKGYAIGLATRSMMQAVAGQPLVGGLVNVGGDIRCFGVSPRGGKWRVGVRNPFDPEQGAFFGTLELAGGSVFTSGSYERYVVIDGKRYSHIVDPRTGWPAGAAPSVTVLAPAAQVYGWATALCVLGPEGLKVLPPGIEAMIVVGGPGDCRIHQTSGFARYLVAPIPGATTAPATTPTAGPR